MNVWKKSYCQSCAFKVNDRCRRFPPTWKLVKFASYPVVHDGTLACAEFKSANLESVIADLNQPYSPPPLASQEEKVLRLADTIH